MIRLTIRLLPWGLCAISLLFLAIGLGGLLGTTEESPTTVAARALTTQPPPAAKYLKVVGGVLYWPQAITHYVEKKASGGGAREVKGHLVPLIDPADETMWAALKPNARRPELSRIVYVSIAPEQMITLFPDAARGEPKSTLQPFEVVGTTTDEYFWPAPLKSFVVSSLAMLPKDVLVIEHGGVPLQKSSAAGILVVGILLAAVGGLWLRQRRRQARAPVPADILAAIRAGASEGFSKPLTPEPGM